MDRLGSAVQTLDPNPDRRGIEIQPVRHRHIQLQLVGPRRNLDRQGERAGSRDDEPIAVGIPDLGRRGSGRRVGGQSLDARQSAAPRRATGQPHLLDLTAATGLELLPRPVSRADTACPKCSSMAFSPTTSAPWGIGNVRVVHSGSSWVVGSETPFMESWMVWTAADFGSS